MNSPVIVTAVMVFFVHLASPCIRTPSVPPVAPDFDPYAPPPYDPGASISFGGPLHGFQPGLPPPGGEGFARTGPDFGFEQPSETYDTYVNYLDSSEDYSETAPYANKKKKPIIPTRQELFLKKKPDLPPIVLHFRPDRNRDVSPPEIVSKSLKKINFGGNIPAHLERYFRGNKPTFAVGKVDGKVPQLKIFDKKETNPGDNLRFSPVRVGKSDNISGLLDKTLIQHGKSLDTVERFLGEAVKTSRWNNQHYNEASGGPITEEVLLDCNFDTPCCYTNAEVPEDQVDWVVASGEPDLTLLNSIFGTASYPSGNYLLATLPPGGHDPGVEARFVSCAIGCTSKETLVSLNHWTSGSVEIKVCTTDGFVTDPAIVPLRNCKTLAKHTSPGPEIVALPKGKNFNVVIVATNFSYEGGMAIVDNLLVDYSVCRDQAPDTTSKAAIKSHSKSLKRGESTHECQTAACDFENNNACSYANIYDSTIRTNPPTRVFDVKAGRFKNSVTGIKQAGQGFYYLATYLHAGEVAGLETQTVFLENRRITFFYYAATQHIEVFGCCDSVSRCPYQSSQIIDFTDRVWRQASYTCPQGTSKIIFLCTNEGGNQGACGLDNIQIYSEGQSKNLCNL